MNDDLAIRLVVAGSVATGFAWGRLSCWVRIPELLKLLCTPMLTGALATLLGWGLMLARHDSTTLPAQEFANLPFVLAARVLAGYTCMFFTAGVAFGLPGVLGWAIGYRQRPLS